jgi:prepilin-type N-terminal cleavage/methylation domain-containing protein
MLEMCDLNPVLCRCPRLGVSQANARFSLARRGFSLVELLVVIGIIAVLVAILLPALGRARAQAQSVACSSNQRQVAIAILMYANDNKGVLPPYGCMLNNPSNELGGNYWWQLTAKYISKTGSQPGVNMLRCPSERDANRAATYGVNYGYTNVGGVFAYQAINFVSPQYAGSQRVTKVKLGTFLTGDSIYWSGGADLAVYSPFAWPFNVDSDSDGVVDSSSAFYPTGKTPYNKFDPRHIGGAVCSFIDGSVRKVLLKEWVTNKDKIWGR